MSEFNLSHLHQSNVFVHLQVESGGTISLGIM